MYPGCFYISGGAKFRELKFVRIETRRVDLLTIIDPGSPAFGGNIDGPLLYPPTPTGTSGTAPSTSGIWAYDDGFIEPTGGAGTTPVLYPSGVTAGLGHFIDGADTGSFQIFDFRVQANDGGSSSFSNTTALSWSKLLSGVAPTSTNQLNLIPGLGAEPAPGTPYFTEVASRGFAVTTEEGAGKDFQTRVWGPYIEFGFQSTALFDVFTGLSVFQTSQTFSDSRQTFVSFARRGYRDNFAFESSDPAAWTPLNFYSVNGTLGFSYFIFPNDGDGKPIPARAFFSAIDPSVFPTLSQGSTTAKLDLTTWESRVGGRTWIPLWGMGRFGTSFGGLLAASPQTLTSNSIFVATVDNPAAGVVAGDVLINNSLKTDSTPWNLGLFGGIDIEIGAYRWFAKSVLEYDYYYYGSTVESDTISANINLSGVSATFLGGVRF